MSRKSKDSIPGSTVAGLETRLQNLTLGSQQQQKPETALRDTQPVSHGRSDSAPCSDENKSWESPDVVGPAEFNELTRLMDDLVVSRIPSSAFMPYIL
ncbi:hypothetical protein VTP01DRAFT_2849 [Rhizomucor pusillus]|uniref:uncharacterized protein n=1 Tax=Rhizomucor pusillus TaxID=4840 RepID=UPI003743DDD4